MRPASSSQSCTNRAPFIDSIAARHRLDAHSDALAQAAQTVGTGWSMFRLP